MFALAHLSDPHLSPMPRPKLRDLMGKRAVGYFNWRSNRGAHHSPDFLSTLVADMKARGFDHLAVTGDLVNLGLPDKILWRVAAIIAAVAGFGVYHAVVRLTDEFVNPRTMLAITLMSAGAGTVLLFVVRTVLSHSTIFDEMHPITQVVGWTFSLFFLPMFVLGMVSPQVIRLSVPDVAHVGRVAGRVYAWSTAGAIVGTFAAGYFTISTFGMARRNSNRLRGMW